MDISAHCLLCDQSGDHGSLCSFACVDAAQREIERNVRRYKRLPQGLASDGERYAIAMRNGLLTSAVLSWGTTTSL